MSAPSDYFQTQTVQDDRIQAITDKIQYAVVKGASSNNPVQNTATSLSTSSIVFNQPIPSETTLVDRRMVLRTEMIFKLDRTADATVIRYPQTLNLAPFPLHQMCQTISLTLNNTSISVQIRDILAPMLRVMEEEDLYEFNSCCPTAFDRYGKYTDEAFGYDADSASAPTSADLINMASGKSYSNFQGFGGMKHNHFPRGAFFIEGLYDDAGATTLATTRLTTASVSSIFMRVITHEPVMISPLCWGKSKGQQAMYGLQNIILQYTLTQDASRAIRSTNSFSSVSLSSIVKCDIQMNFLTPQPSTLLNARNVLPHYQIERLVSPFNSNSAVSINNPQTIGSNTFTLSVIPDYIVVYVRPPTSSLKHYKPDAFAVIEKINIQFANNSGILSTATQQTLFQMSIENGYNGSWHEFANKAYGNGSILGGSLLPLATTGSVLILRFGKDIQLPEFASPGCVGNWSLKIDVLARELYSGHFKEENWTTSDTTSRTSSATELSMELNILTVVSGVVVLERGQSSVHLGLLTRQDALDASSGEAMSFHASQKLVGKGFFDGIGSILGKVKDFATNAYGIAQKVSPLVRLGANAFGKPEIGDMLSKVGLGKTGGGYSGNNLSHRIA